MQVRSLGWEDPLEEGMANNSSTLAWSIPWTEEPGGLQCIGSQSRSQLKQLSTYLGKEFEKEYIYILYIHTHT